MFRKFLTEQEDLLSKYTDKRDEVVAEFVGYMHQAILNCARNVTRKMLNDKRYNEGISLEALDEKNYGEYLTREDRHTVEDGIELELKTLKLRLDDDLLKKLLSGLTEREVQALILYEVYDLDYDQIGKLLGISRDRAKAYKYHGMKKAKRRAKKHGRKKRD